MYRLLALIVLAGCAPATFAFTPMLQSVTPKPDSCPVEVITSLPTRGYQEVGTLELYSGSEPKTLDAFKEAVAKQVCQVGGDAVIAIADDKRQFTKGTVIAYTDSGAPVPARKGAAPEQQNDNELPK